jgi:nitrate/nitrite transporter NarK
VLLGSVGRLPAGMLADRFGGRRVFAALLLLSALPAVAVGFSTSYTQLLWLGLFLGLAGSTFPVGVGFTSKWFSAEKQGTALGVCGMGNIGQSVAVFGAPLLVAYAFGDNWRPVFFVFPPLALGLIRDATCGYAWGLVFLACFALACLAVHYFVLVRPDGGARPERNGVGAPQVALR